MRTLTRGLLAAACTVALLGLGAGAAQAQFLIDHYKVYNLLTPEPSGLPVSLDDQFGPSSHTLLTRTKFANPVLKTIPPVDPVPFPGSLLHPFEHLSWWAISEPFGPLAIQVSNQLGPLQPWVIGDAEYLLVPASKNSPFPVGIDLNQHYKCYIALSGPELFIINQLSDQFGIFPHVLTTPRYFCNPVEKLGPPPLEPSGPPPIPSDHLACYEIGPNGDDAVTVADQVLVPNLPAIMDPAEMLCVPSFKAIPETPTMGAPGFAALISLMLLTGVAARWVARRRRATIA
jgi:hypothetical protein